MVVHTATAVVAGVLMALTQAGTGHADPSPAEVERQIDANWNNLEPLIEQHNKLKIELDANREKVQKLTEQLAPLQLKVDLSQSRVGNISAKHYKGGSPSAFNAILASGSPLALADQLTLLDRMAHNEMLEIKDVVELKAQYEAQKKPLDTVLAEQNRQEAELSEKEKVINAEVKRLNELRVKVYGTSGAIGNLRLAPCPFDYTNDPGGRAAQIACAQIGKAYVWATQGPNTFDCSGLMMYAWSQATGNNVKLRHYTNWQYDDTQRVSRDQLRAGDLIFYFSDLHHVGMYVGGGWMVHAPTSGDVVRMARFDAFSIAGYGRPRT
jgi:cell wall-associated NlpC family hydrolase